MLACCTLQCSAAPTQVICILLSGFGMVSLMSRFGPLEELLSAPIQDAMSGRKAIVLSAATSVRQAVATLAENRILSAPVVESEGAVRGFVDYMDIVAYMSATGDIEKRFTDRVDAVAGEWVVWSPYM